MVLASLLCFAQSDTQAPAGQHAILTAAGKGVQIYACQAQQWVFVAPEAKLFDQTGNELGTHSAGPLWKFNDGRTIKGQVIAKSDAPDAANIPWLLLKADGGGIEYIRRSDTRGGVAPATRCEAGRTEKIPYSATYTFYAPSH
jgi:hypothetical protein